MHPPSSLPMYPTPTSIRHPPPAAVATKEQFAVDAQMLAAKQAQIEQSYTLPARVAHWSMITATSGALLACAGFLLLFSIGASHCTGTRVSSGGLQTGEPAGMELISETICALAVSTRYWLLAMLGLNTVAFVMALPSLARATECCELGVSVHGWRGFVMVFLGIGHLLSTCLLVGWLYTSDTPSSMLPILHCASITVLFSTLVLATSVATTFFLQHEQRIIGKTRSRRNSLDLEKARDAIAQATQQNSRNGNSGRSSPHSVSLSTRRQRMANTEIAAPAKVNTPPALHTSALVGDLASGMSLTEIKQLVTQVVPCCTPQTILDSTTGETIILPCCSRAPILPSSSVPLGFTSPRRKDHGPTADLTDASGATENLQSPMVQGTLVVPPHLRLNTSSPANGAAAMNGGLDSFDTRPANTPLALHAPANSPLAQVLTHGPSPLLDAGCELCRDAFQAHQLVKILPECGHAMHSSCIVPYLTHRRDCPSCHTEVLPAGKNKHAELSRLVMQSPSSSQHGEDHLALGGAGTPNGHHVHGTPSTTQRDSGSSSPSHLNVLHLTSPPSAVAKPDLTVSALTSCGAEKDGFNYALDSVKLTPAHPSTIEGQMTQRHAATNGSVPASIKLDQKMKNGSLSTVTSPVVSRSPHAGSPTPPIPVHLESVKCE